MRRKLITAKEVSEMTGLSEKTVYAGKGGLGNLTRVPLGRSVRFILQEVEEFIDSLIELSKR